ncbi:MAG: DUF2141 domain-containing protein [Bacteroidales bacterium]|nr:DUF2141 domain-containing protein [Bacteroidales bacterium]MDD4216891.1 DUF2141 domain-containing protein [Bacteroidales bacterium]MDY0140585.1 DUF2141 domain-containing protein [Bacteroidales bacterium]
MKNLLKLYTKNLRFANCIAFFAIGLFLTSSLNAQTLHIKIEGIKNSKGVIQLGFFKSAQDYKNDISFFKFIDKKSMKNGTIYVSYTDIKPGTYGIALLDDENNNKKMDFSFFIPTEGFGFSDYYATGLSKPSFDKFSFYFGGKDKTVVIKIRYI